MKKRLLIVFILSFVFVGAVKALSYDDYFESLGNCRVNAVNSFVRDCENGEMTLSYTIDITQNTITFETKETNVNSAVANEKIFKYLLNRAPQELKNEYSDVVSNDKTPNYEDYNCQIDKVGYCFKNEDDSYTLTVRVDETYIKYLIAYHKGTPIGEDTDTQKDVVGGDTTTGTETTTTGDSKNPDTGSFAQYSVIVLLAVALVYVIHLKRRSEVQYKI